MTNTDTDTDGADAGETASDDGASAEDDSAGDGDSGDGDGDGDDTTTGDGDGTTTGDGDGDGTSGGDGDGDGDGDGTSAGDGDGDGTCSCQTNMLAVAVSPFLVGQTRSCSVAFGDTAAEAIAVAMAECGANCNLSHDPTTQSVPAAVGAVAFTATGSYHGYGWSSNCDLASAEFNAVANCEAISGETCTLSCSEQYGTPCP